MCHLLPDPATLSLEYIDASDTSCGNGNGGSIVLVVSASAPEARCPGCGRPSERIHSRYQRRVADLPWNGVPVRLRLTVRRFRCGGLDCQRRIFTERLPRVVRSYARKTDRLQDALHLIGLALGGEAGARMARGLGLSSASPDTLLRQVKRDAPGPGQAPRVLGVDDFAFRRGQRYGTILVDLERRCLVDLLPDREAATLAEWLKQHPGVEILSRDRGAAYIEGATRGAPDAVQVADRFHLLKNLSDALERAVLRNYRAVRQAVAVLQAPAPQTTLPPLPEPTPQPLSPAQREVKALRRERRLGRFEEVKRLSDQGLSHHEIARRLGMSRNTIRRFVLSEGFPEIAARPPRRGKLTPFVPHLKRRWQEGCGNAVQLYREIAAQGFTGSVDTVQHAVVSWRERPRCRLPSAGRKPPVCAPPPRRLSFLLAAPDHPKVTEDERALLTRLCEDCPALSRAQDLAQGFRQMVRERQVESFPGWLEQVAASELTDLKTFARGLKQDRAAVEAALSCEWSNGQVEGQVNRLKMIKRQMYGRAGFDLLRARVLAA